MGYGALDDRALQDRWANKIMNPYAPPSQPSPDPAPSETRHKGHPLSEALAAGFMVIGAIALVATLFPWINPTQYGMNTTGDESLPVRTFIGGSASASLLWAAFYFNRRAKRLAGSKR